MCKSFLNAIEIRVTSLKNMHIPSYLILIRISYYLQEMLRIYSLFGFHPLLIGNLLRSAISKTMKMDYMDSHSVLIAQILNQNQIKYHRKCSFYSPTWDRQVSNQSHTNPPFQNPLGRGFPWANTWNLIKCIES